MTNLAARACTTYQRHRPGAALLLVALASVLPGTAAAEGTPAGTVIDNTAQVEFDLNGSRLSVASNLVSVVVAERIDMAFTVQTPQVLVSAGDSNRTLLITLTNTGNGNETFRLDAVSNLAGDDFDPVPATNPIYFDTDASGDLTVGDVVYAAGSNDPVLAADESVTLLLVNDIPGGVVDGDRGLSQITATSLTGTGAPGTVFAGLGDGGVDAVIGTSGGSAAETAEYVVSDIRLEVVKSVTVADPFGGTEPVPGATLTYTIDVQVTSGGVATNSVFTDPVPANTTYTASTIALNASPLTDAVDGDEGEFDAGNGEIVVRLGDLTIVDGVQTITFEVTID